MTSYIDLPGRESISARQCRSATVRQHACHAAWTAWHTDTLEIYLQPVTHSREGSSEYVQAIRHWQNQKFSHRAFETHIPLRLSSHSACSITDKHPFTSVGLTVAVFYSMMAHQLWYHKLTHRLSEYDHTETWHAHMACIVYSSPT